MWLLLNIFNPRQSQLLISISKYCYCNHLISFRAYLGSALYDMPLELRAILALLYNYPFLHSSTVWFLAATTTIFSRSGLMVVLLNHSNVVYIHDRNAYGSYYNATCNWQKSVHCKRSGKGVTSPILYFVQRIWKWTLVISLSFQIALFVLWCYGSKFLPTVITIVLSQCISFLTLCPTYTTDSKCLYVYPDAQGNVSWGGWGDKPNIILVIQHFALSLLVLHLGKIRQFQTLSKATYCFEFY